jgi:TPP-dependent trihydroxycyclohexane-1,2-dione (THcHDO) dehydratase
MRDDQKAIDKARRQLQAERHNNATVAAGVETVLNAKEKEINAWEAQVQWIARAQSRADEMRKIVERHTIEIVKFKSGGWREGLEAHHKKFGIKTASTEEERLDSLQSAVGFPPQQYQPATSPSLDKHWLR